ncbi:MAG: hypothetical protein ACPLXO_00955 [Desulfurella sp.]
MQKKLFKVCNTIAMFMVLIISTEAKADLLSNLSNGNTGSLGQQMLNSYTDDLSSQGFYDTYAPQYYESAQYLQQAGQSIGNGLNLQSLINGNFNWQGLLNGGIGSIYSQFGNIKGIIQQLSSGQLSQLATGSIISQISQAPITLLSFASPTIANSLQNMQNQAAKIYSSTVNTYQKILDKSSLGSGVLSQGIANSLVSCIQQNVSGGMDLSIALTKCSQSQQTPQYVPLVANNDNQLASSMDVTQQSATVAGLNGKEKNIYTYYVGDISINNGQVQANIKKNPVLSAYDNYSKYYSSLIVGAMKDPTNTSNVNNNLQEIVYQTGVTITPNLLINLANSPDGTLYAKQLGSQIAIERIKKDIQLVNSALGVAVQKAKTQGNVALTALLQQRQATLNKQFADYENQDVNANIAQIAQAVQKSNTKRYQDSYAAGVNPLATPYANPSLNSYEGEKDYFGNSDTGQNVVNAINNSIIGTGNSLIQNKSLYQQNLSNVNRWNQ